MKMKGLASRYVNSEYIVPAVFLILSFFAWQFSGLSGSFVLNQVITRFIRDGLLVLALIIPVVAGMGLNFAITVGAMAMQSALLVMIAYNIDSRDAAGGGDRHIFIGLAGQHPGTDFEPGSRQGDDHHHHYRLLYQQHISTHFFSRFRHGYTGAQSIDHPHTGHRGKEHGRSGHVPQHHRQALAV